jgi:hypothetical protein
MKQLKSSLNGLGQLFERSLAVRDLAEPLVSFDDTRAADVIRAFMDDKDYDVVGVRNYGLVRGYVQRSDITMGTLADHFINFDKWIVLDEASPVLDALGRLAKSDRLFVTRGVHPSHRWGIITRGDLQKAPIRMYLFGLISLLEMQFLKLIRGSYPNEEWRGMVSLPRLKRASGIFKDRRHRNEGTDLADCLEFADKAKIAANSDDRLHSKLGFQPRTKDEPLFEELTKLRNDLAHGHDIIAPRWPRLVDLAKETEKLLELCEGLTQEN